MEDHSAPLGDEFWLGAEVCLTVRDPDRRYASAAETILRLNELRAADDSPLPLTPEVAARRKVLNALLEAVMFTGTLQARAADREFAMAAFAAHNDAVRSEVPAERPLVYKVAEGWEPLCRFLGVPVPEGESFPYINDTAAFREKINRFAPAASGGSAP